MPSRSKYIEQPNVRVLLFEYTTGGGLFAEPAPDASQAQSAATIDVAPLAAEGTAMIEALTADFAALPDASVTVLRDERCAFDVPSSVTQRMVRSAAECLAAFDEETARADATVVIAPEIAGQLLRFVDRVAACGGRLLGPSAATVRLASDKHATAEHLRCTGVPAPRGLRLDHWLRANEHDDAPGARLAFPLVLKPRDGAGSLGVRLWRSMPAVHELPADPPAWRVEEFCPGMPTSVALLCGPAGCLTLAPCAQTLSDEDHFAYHGGWLPLPAPLTERATRLARRVAATLPGLLGYIGIDMVMGADPEGGEDYCIEINPRLTTSYAGLRRAAEGNLAAAMLAVAAGEMPPLEFSAARIEFGVP